MPKVANSRARDFVDDRLPFRGSNTYGRTLFDGSYAAFSYGEHWPLYLWWRASDQWFANAGEYSMSTSRHAGQLRPRIVTTVPLPTSALIRLVEFCDGGYAGFSEQPTRIQRMSREIVAAVAAAPAEEAETALPQPPDAWPPPGKRRLLPLGQ
jgi:hypothetical protein